jgi:predicted metal-dependent phosphoesterase TrpH
LLRIDLHLHSTFSDGIFSPKALTDKLARAKVSVASLTDHDSVDGVALFLASCRKRAIRAVSGVEFSARHDGILHILGYRFDIEDAALKAALDKNKRARHERNLQICQNLRNLGFDVNLEDVRALAGSDVIGRPHLARLMVNRGYASSLKEAFDKYLKKGGAAYAPRPLLPPEECIRLIRGAGGLPVMAHPLQTTPDLDDLPPLLEKLKDYGLWGLECWASGSSPGEIYRTLGTADRFGLYPTAGSDFHGGDHTAHGVGVVVEESLLPWARFCGGLQ